MNLHPELLAAVERRFADRLAAPPRLTQDALNLSLANGAVLSVRYAAPDLSQEREELVSIFKQADAGHPVGDYLRRSAESWRIATDLLQAVGSAEVTEHSEGGVVARAPGRRVDLSLPALADRALDRLGGEVRALWEP